MKSIKVEVVHARPDAAKTVTVSIPAGSTAAEAVRASGLPHHGTFGVFGKRVAPDFRLREGDRVELYRPLAQDPKEARRRRARKTP